MIPAGLKKWLAFGNGIGIEIAGPHGSESILATAVRVRPNGARVLAQFEVEDVPHQPAGVWGTDYAAFVRKTGLRHVAATVLLPRQDLIVRQLNLPGVSDSDLPSAVQFQMDGLHPYPEDDVLTSWARLAGTSTVLVAIARRASIERYVSWFDEAGIKIASFTTSTAAIYSALRLLAAAPPAEFLADQRVDGHIEFYGESPAHAVFSASFPAGSEAEEERAAALARAELRLDPNIALRPLEELLAPSPGPYAAALASACPRLSLILNLLPRDQRQTSSRMQWIPSAVLGAIVLFLAGALAAFPGFEDRRYLNSLQSEIAKIEPRAARSSALDRETETARERTVLLDDFRRRTKSNLDVLEEMTRILPPPTWLTQLEITPTLVVVAGETDQAAPLLRVIDASPLFQASEFAMPPVRSPAGEMFRIRTTREAGK
jgi:Tfp pilus assembly protein PilN